MRFILYTGTKEQYRYTLKSSNLGTIKKSDFFINYTSDRVDIAPLVQKAFRQMDSNKLIEAITRNMEEYIAKKLVDKITTEMGHDIKHLLGNATVRDDFRFMQRKMIEEILDKVRPKN